MDPRDDGTIPRVNVKFLPDVTVSSSKGLLENHSENLGFYCLAHSKYARLESTNSHTHLPTQCHKLQLLFKEQEQFLQNLLTSALCGGQPYAM